jgi:hypothetical protein
MRIFAIADLHLSGWPPTKPMSIFGDHWLDHWEKIRTNWLEQVEPEDAVLLPGDISWAMKLDEALPDLKAIAALPGKKLLVKGNHDYWWQSTAKMNAALGGQLTFIHNSFAPLGEIAVCGSRGWISPQDPSFGLTDQPIYLRELGRIRHSLTAARAAGYERIILMTHFPLLYDHQPNHFSDLLAEFAVDICVYGHLHNESVATAPTGIIHGTVFHLVSCDALHFQLKKII